MTLRRLILLGSLIGLTSSLVLAATEERYQFERLWPVLPQPWYFDEIWDIAVSQQGDVYVVDRRHNRVQKWTSNGHLVSQFGTFNDGLRPIELAVDSQENVYVSYTVTNPLVDSGEEKFSEMFVAATASRLAQWSHLIRKFNANGELLEDEWRASAQCPENIGHIAVDHQDHVYMTCVPTEAGQAFIHRLTSDGQWLEKWPIDSDGNIAIDREHLYILEKTDNRVHKYTRDGEWLMDWHTGENEIDEFISYKAKDIAVDNRGNVYVTDNLNRVQQLTSEGHLIKEWRDEINLNGTFQISSQQTSLIQWVYLKSILHSMLCPTADSVPNEANEGVEICNQSQQFEALLDYESSFPTTIAVGPQGEVYVGYTTPSSAIKKYTSTGQFITQWTNGNNRTPQFLQAFSSLFQGFMQWRTGDSGGNARFQFHQPTDIAIDTNGDLYVVDSLAHQVLKFTKEGQLVTLWGEFGQGEGQLSSPQGIAIDTDNNIYIADTGNGRIQKFTSDGMFITQWNGNSDLLALAYLAVDRNNNVYVVDAVARQIKKFTSDGEFITAFGDKHLSRPWSIVVDHNDTIYVTDPVNKTVNKFTTDGSFLGEWHTQGSQDGQFEKPFVPLSVATDAVGNVYVSDFAKGSIQKFTPDGQFITQWGTFGTSPGQFNQADSLAVSPAGDHVYVVEQMNNRIQVFNRTRHDIGKAIIVAGGGPYESNSLWDDTQMLANFAYRALAHQGFTPNTIYYLSAATTLDLDNNCQYNKNGVIDESCYDVDAEPTQANLRTAITEWARDADNLTIYMIDHGGDQAFLLNEDEILTAADLNNWLDIWQSQTQGRHLKMVYDAAYSGSFAPLLAGPNRMIITSAGADELAYFNDRGSLSFSSYFWTNVFQGLNIAESFRQATSAMNSMHHLEIQGQQTPWLEANGDSCVNKAADYQQAAQFFIGNGTYIQADAPVIEAVSPPQTLIDTNTALIHAQVSDEDIVSVWAVVRSPVDIQRHIQQTDHEYKDGVVGQPVIELPTFELHWVKDNNRYEGSYDAFKIAGRYELAIYARDLEGNTSVPNTTSVVVETPFKRKAIMIAGELPFDAQNNLKEAYDALKYQGYQSEHIYFISNTSVSGVDAQPVQATVDNVEFALTEWAKNNSQNLVIYLEGLGNKTEFELSHTERLPLAQLKTGLDALQPPNIQGTVTVIYEGPFSGHLLAALKEPPEGQTRIVISSTGIDEIDSVDDDSTDYPFSFAKFFWQKVYNGANTYNAFNQAKSAITLIHDWQTPQLDGNGNGIGNETPDFDVAKTHSIGIGVITATKKSLRNKGYEAKSRCLIPSQLNYHRGEQVEVTLEMLMDYERYLAVGLPNGELFTIPGKNQFLPFQSVEKAPVWSDGRTVIDIPLDANIPLGGYRLYSVTVPAGTPLESPLNPEMVCKSGFCVE